MKLTIWKGVYKKKSHTQSQTESDNLPIRYVAGRMLSHKKCLCAIFKVKKGKWWAGEKRGTDVLKPLTLHCNKWLCEGRIRIRMCFSYLPNNASLPLPHCYSFKILVFNWQPSNTIEHVEIGHFAFSGGQNSLNTLAIMATDHTCWFVVKFQAIVRHRIYGTTWVPDQSLIKIISHWRC